MIEFAIQILGELFVQTIGHALVELGFHSLAEPLRRSPSPLLSAIGFITFGAICGGLSLIAFSLHFMSPPWRILNLIVTPLVVGGMMSLMGNWRASQGGNLIRFNQFVYGYLFALSFAMIRFLFAS